MPTRIESYRINGRTLAQAYPEVAAEWNYELNNDTPWDIGYGSVQKRWFTCSNGHNYLTKPNLRTSKKSSCSYCGKTNKKVGYGNDLQTKYPLIAKEWSEKNRLKSNEVVSGSTKKVLWKCKDNHEWEARINDRVFNKSNCPKCAKGDTSKPEIKLAKLLNGKQGLCIGGYKPDIVIGDTIIEYDGSYYHKNKYEYDIKKTNKYKELGYKVIRVRVQDKNNILKDIPGAINIHFNVEDERKLNIKQLANNIKARIQRIT